MRCDNCGQDIPEGQQILSTRSEQLGTPGYEGAKTSTDPIWLCRTCAEKRRWFGIIAWTLVITFLIFALFIMFSGLRP